jgi:hypothetical protein
MRRNSPPLSQKPLTSSTNVLAMDKFRDLCVICPSSAPPKDRTRRISHKTSGTLYSVVDQLEPNHHDTAGFCVASTGTNQKAKLADL